MGWWVINLLYLIYEREIFFLKNAHYALVFIFSKFHTEKAEEDGGQFTDKVESNIFIMRLRSE